MPAAKKSKLDSTAATIPGAVDGSAILESNVITVSPPTTFPLEMSNTNQTLTFSIPSNPRLFWDPSQTLLSATFRVVLNSGLPFSSRNFSLANGLLFSGIKRISCILNGREVFYQDNFGLHYLLHQFSSDVQATLASSNSHCFYTDGFPSDTTEAFGQGIRRGIFQHSRAIKLLGRIPMPQLQCLQLWPTDAEISIVIQWHSSERLLWEQKPTVPPPTPIEKLKLQLVQCQLLAATKLFRDTVPRPLVLKSRFIENTCFQYLADSDAFESNSSSFILNSYPRGFYIFLMPSDGDDRYKNPYSFPDIDELQKFHITVADREYTINVNRAETHYMDVVAQNNQYLVGRGSDQNSQFAFQSFFTKEKVESAFLIAYQDCRRSTGGREKDTTLAKDITFAEGSPCRIRFSTRHNKKITDKFYVIIVFESLASLSLDRQTNRVQVEHF